VLRLISYLFLAPLSTAAGIIKEYLATATQSKMVDFAIYLRPKLCADEAEAAERLLDLRRAAPELSANHTDMEALVEGPITVSIETKREESSSAHEANLQIGTWQAAQWKMLARQAADVHGSLLDLEFLPCLIVYGHEWYFAASSREGNKTVRVFLCLHRPPPTYTSYAC